MKDADYEQGRTLLADCDDAWPAERMALVVFTPGCLVAGRLGKGLDLIEEGGFTPTFGRLFHFTAPLVRRIWRYQLGTFSSDRWGLIVDLLLVGPSFLTLCVDESPGRVSAAQRMTVRKGPSDPLLGQPGQMRTELGGLNKIMNLMHCAQDTCDVVRETAILLGDSEFRSAWSRGSQASAGRAREWWPLAAPMRRPNGVSFVHTAAGLRRRVVEAMAARLGVAFPGAVWDLIGEESNLLKALRPYEPLVALAAYRERSPVKSVAELLRPALAAATDADGHLDLLAQGLAELDTALLADRCDIDRLWCSLDQAGMEIDEWERLILATQHVTSGMAAHR
jgi:hypothetical protein